MVTSRNAGYALAPNFALGEFPGWERATGAQLDNLARIVRDLIQPARDAWGPIRITSWLRDTGSGAHKDGGAVDFVPVYAAVPVVHRWMAANVAPFGELIDERDHIHVTLPGVGGWGQVLIEPTEGEYAAVDSTAARPPNGAPAWWYDIRGITATVAGPVTWARWLIVGGLLLAVVYPRRR